MCLEQPPEGKWLLTTEQNDEVLFLPPIVDAAESSPEAAAECARVIRKFLSKEYMSRPAWQYNALMLVRILADNPGLTFTRAFDSKFVETVRLLLKNGKDRSVFKILVEMLDDFERSKSYDDNLAPLVLMWKGEREQALKKYGVRIIPPSPRLNLQIWTLWLTVSQGKVPPLPPRPNMAPPMPNQNYFARAHTNNRLPDTVELASRLEEARTSAKLLEQVVMNTPPADINNDELIREFADRCLSASRSLQGYMVSENPAPDNDTMESLIDTNEQLQTALNQHKRAVLSARKQVNPDAETPSPSPPASDRGRDPTSVPATAVLHERGKGKQALGYNLVGGGYGNGNGSGNGGEASSSRQSLKDEPAEDPFADPAEHKAEYEFPHEPFNPGFGFATSASGALNGSVSGSRAASASGSTSKLKSTLDDVSDDDDIYEATAGAKGKASKE